MDERVEANFFFFGGGSNQIKNEAIFCSCSGLFLEEDTCHTFEVVQV